jgi:hypothetical protein
MTDYLLKFPSREVAFQFGMENGFAAINEAGEAEITLASHEYALNVIGEHNGADWWVLFRDLAGIPIPPNADPYIFWSSAWTVIDEDGNEIQIPRPDDTNPDVPNIFWA